MIIFSIKSGICMGTHSIPYLHGSVLSAWSVVVYITLGNVHEMVRIRISV